MIRNLNNDLENKLSNKIATLLCNDDSGTKVELKVWDASIDIGFRNSDQNIHYPCFKIWRNTSNYGGEPCFTIMENGVLSDTYCVYSRKSIKKGTEDVPSFLDHDYIYLQYE